MTPILNGPGGFILLTLSVGIGAYVRQVYVGCTEIYDKIEGGELSKLWPRDAKYTTDRLDNLRYVQRNLRIATFLMFLFILLSSLRLLAYAANTVPLNTIPALAYLDNILDVLRTSDAFLSYSDLFLLLYLTLAFAFMWLTHWQGSKKEHEYHAAMYAALEPRKAQPQLN